MNVDVILSAGARRHRVERTRQFLASLDRSVSVYETTGPGDVRAIAAELSRNGCDRLVIAGGDSSVGEAISGIFESGPGLAHVTLGVLPIGTLNVFAAEHGLPTNLRDSWEISRGSRNRLIDVGVARFSDDSGNAVRSCFAQLGGVGLDSRALQFVSPSLKRRFGSGAYVLAGIRSLLSNPESVKLRVGDHAYTGSTVLFSNGIYYWKGLPLFRDGSASNGRIGAIVLPRMSLSRLLFGMLRSLNRPLAVALGGDSVQARRIEIRAETQVALELDGGLVGRPPAFLSVAPIGLKLAIG